MPSHAISASDAANPGAIEPAELPRGENAAATADAGVSLEPDLPAPERAELEVSADYQPEELSPMPRRFRYTLSVDIRAVYDDNVTLSRGADRSEDFYTAVAPQVTAGIGDVLERQENFVSLNYAPTVLIFLENSTFNALEHIARAEGQWRITRLVLALQVDFSYVQSSNLGIANTDGGFSNQANLDVGGRRPVIQFSTRFSAAAPLSGKTSVRFGAHYSLVEPEDLIASETLSGTLGVDYRYGPKLGIGFDVTAGMYLVEEPSPDQTFEQLNLRADYELTGKLKATGSAGVEFRQSEGSGSDHLSPIFQFGIGYAPFDATQIDISATRRTLNSASAAGQDFTSTQFIVTARQRFLQRIFFTLSTGYQTHSYFSTVDGRSSVRDDKYYFIAPGFDVRLTDFWYAGAFFTHRQNNSSQELYSFNDNQYGIRTTLRF